MNEEAYSQNNFYTKTFYTTWPKWLGGVLLAFLNIGLFLYLMPLFGVYPAMADWGIWTFKLAGLDIPTPWGSTLELPHLSSRSIVNFGLLFGAFIGALLSREFMIRKATIGAYLQSTAGGVLMGIGSFLVGSCIIGGFYSSIMALSLSGFYMMAGLLAGAYLGGKLLIWQKSRGPVSDDVDAPPKTNPKPWLPMVGVAMTIVLVSIAVAYFQNNRDILGGVILFSAAFGLVFQRASFGFATAFRDVFTSKSNETMRGVMISMIIGVIGFSIIKVNGIKPAQMFVSPAGWHTVIGGLIFGFGMVMADG